MNTEAIFDRLGGIYAIYGQGFKPLSETEIEGLETSLDCRFPDAYRQFLLKYGASSFRGTSDDDPFVYFRSITPLPDYIADGELAIFDTFFGTNNGPKQAYSLLTRINFYKGRMPSTLIPIGDDGGAGLICLGIGGNDYGQIFYWDQADEALSEEEYLEDYEEPRPPEALYQNLYLVASSFTNFLKQLQLSEKK
jgi:hypothetical protein